MEKLLRHAQVVVVEDVATFEDEGIEGLALKTVLEI
jgi:hypothetical protein